jgi:hypothetical protein
MRMIYRVEYIRTGTSNWTLAAEGNEQGMMINRAKSVAREPRRDKVRVIDGNGIPVWMS